MVEVQSAVELSQEARCNFIAAMITSFIQTTLIIPASPLAIHICVR